MDKVTRIAGSQSDLESTKAGATIAFYIALFRPWRRRMWQVALGAAIATYIVTKFMMTPWYRSQAVIRPASQEPQTGMNLNAILGSATGGLGGILGGSSSSDVNELVTIMSSYEFTTELIEDNKLAPIILAHVPPIQRFFLWLNGGRSTPWKLYQIMGSRFDFNFDSNLGNLTIGFQDPDRKQAQRILGLYISTSRSRLRARYVEQSKSAIVALQNEIASNSDALLVGQLDGLLANQLQQLGTAEVEADFDFVVVDNPMGPDRPSTPLPLLDSLFAAIIAPLGLLVYVISSDWWHRQRWQEADVQNREIEAEAHKIGALKRTSVD